MNFTFEREEEEEGEKNREKKKSDERKEEEGKRTKATPKEKRKNCFPHDVKDMERNIRFFSLSTREASSALVENSTNVLHNLNLCSSHQISYYSFPFPMLVNERDGS